ncbi:MAG: hypothetical protein NC433_04205 [Clostridiales bacterium]|nr:hypothetical protein [Clostridiales bacterium]
MTKITKLLKTVRGVAVFGLAACIIAGTCSTANAADFDPLWYAEQNPDVVAEFGDSPEILAQHYEMVGKAEGRMSNSTDVEAKLRKFFNAEEYAALYPDVVEAFGNDPDILFQHYVAYGILESRRASEDMRLSTVASLKAAMTNALESVGAEAVPGSAAILAIMEGTLGDEPAVQEVLVQVQDTLVEAVETTIVAASKPEVVPSDDDDDVESDSTSSSSDSSSDSDSDSSSSSDSSSGSSSSSGSGSVETPPTQTTTCEHDWKPIDNDATKHKCSKCNEEEEHTLNEGTCSKCNYTETKTGN